MAGFTRFLTLWPCSRRMQCSGIGIDLWRGVLLCARYCQFLSTHRAKCNQLFLAICPSERAVLPTPVTAVVRPATGGSPQNASTTPIGSER